MHGCFRLLVTNTYPIAISVIVASMLLLLSGCSASRRTRDRDDKEDAATSDSSTREKGSEPDGSFGSTDKDGAVNDPSEVDSRDAGDPVDNQSGTNGGSDGRDAADAEQEDEYEGEDEEGSSDSGIAQPINIPYENLQQIPNSSARVCPGRSYSPDIISMFSTCEEICPRAHCVDNIMISMVSSQESIVNVFYPCGAEASCVPDQLIATQGAVQNKKCRSIGNLEGACISVCNRNTASSLNANFLPQDSCYETEVCVPCYDPIKGGLTAFNPCGNYVSSTCNEGPKEGGTVFDKCCGGNGTCIPGLDDVNPQVAGLLGRDSCTGEDDLCLPSLFGIINYLPAICQTDERDEGRCLSDCLAPSLTENYKRGDCAFNELCIPCSINGKPSGACSLNDDEPDRNSD